MKRVRKQTIFYSPSAAKAPAKAPAKAHAKAPAAKAPAKAEGWTHADQTLYAEDWPAYNLEQQSRRLAGSVPIIICMGGPYSDAWYPPV